jgi:hypothetical protein
MFRLLTAWNKRSELKVDSWTLVMRPPWRCPARRHGVDRNASNPLLRITDIADTRAAARPSVRWWSPQHLLSPGWQRPLNWRRRVALHPSTSTVSDVVVGQ